MLMTDRSSWLFASPKCTKRLAPQDALTRCQGQRPRFTGSLAAPLRSRGAQPCRRRSPRSRGSRSARCRGSLPAARRQAQPLSASARRLTAGTPRNFPRQPAHALAPRRGKTCSLSLPPCSGHGEAGGCFPPASLLLPSARGSLAEAPALHRQAERGARAAHPPRRRPRPRLAE